MGINGLKAQETTFTDSLFIHSYKQLRTLTDKYKTFNVYLVPYQSADKKEISDLHKQLGNVFHFLRGKTIEAKQPDFIIGFLIDDVKLLDPTYYITYFGGNVGIGNNNTSKTNTYKVTSPYRMSINVLVITKNNKRFLFPLTTQTIFAKEFQMNITDEILTALKTIITIDPYTEIKKRPDLLQPNFLDFKNNLIQALGKYEHYYVDRIDN